jgi:glycosyltransferase involved in cell wall biosynthesis
MDASQKGAPRPLLVDLARYFGGAEVRVLNLATAFGAQGCGVACLKDSPLAGRVKEAGLTPLEIREGKASPGLAFSLAQIVRQGSFNILDAHNVQSHWWSRASLALLKVRPASAATVHSSTRQEHPNRLKGGIYEQIERQLLPGFDRVITVSSYLRAELSGWGISQERLSLVPNGVSLERPAKGERTAIRRELGLAPDQPVIGSVGRMEPAKGLGYLLEATARLRSEFPQIRCVIVGEGRLLPELQQFVRQHGLEEAVQFTGFRSDVRRLLEAFDVFVLPSITDGIPIALLEACACAKPVVASRVGGVPEVVADGRSGRLVEASDVTGLANAIAGLLRDPELAERLAGQAEQDVAARYSMASMIAGTRQAYSSALKYHWSRRA